MLGVLAERQGRHADALAHYERAHRMRVDLVGELNARTAIALSNMAVARWNLGDTRSVIDDSRRAITVLERTLGPDHADIAWARRNFADRLLELEQTDEAREQAELSLRESETGLGPDHPYVGNGAISLASVLRELGRTDDALALDARAVAIGRAHPDSDVLGNALVGRAASLRTAGRCAETEASLAEAFELSPPLSGVVMAVHAERARCALVANHVELAALELGAGARSRRSAWCRSDRPTPAATRPRARARRWITRRVARGGRRRAGRRRPHRCTTVVARGVGTFAP